MNRSKTLLKIFVLMAALCMLFGFASIGFADTQYPAIDGKIDLGGYGLYAQAQGEGKPVIIYETGYGDTHDIWNQVAPNVSGYSFTYDRAGLGQSDASPNSRDRLTMVHELHQALQNQGIPAPYIFVVHSMGAYNARIFANEYPGEVSGIVFVDGTPLNYRTEMLVFLEQYMPEMIDFFKTQVFIGEETYDQVAVSEQQLAVTVATDTLRNIPITVMYGTNHEMGDDYEAYWAGRQEDLTALSNNSKLIPINSNHYIQLEQPQAVIDAINDLLVRIEDKQ